MKKILACLMVVAFLVAGCAMGLQSIRPDTSPEKIMSLLIREVKKCEVDARGWKILEIPDRAYLENHIKFVAFQLTTDEDIWGVGLINEEEGAAIVLQHTKEGWVVIQFGMPFQLTDEQAIEFLNEWAKVVAKNGDFSKAGTYKPCGVETQKESL
jgi:hypothetical protein